MNAAILSFPPATDASTPSDAWTPVCAVDDIVPNTGVCALVAGRHVAVADDGIRGQGWISVAELRRDPRQPDLLVPDALVGAVLPAVAGEHHHHADVHGTSSSFGLF